MDPQLIKTLVQAMEHEEREHLDEYKADNTSFFKRGERLYVQRRDVLNPGELIAVRPHTRFTGTPSHRHDYIELMYVCQGTFTHVINGTNVVMEAGDILLMNQYISHAIKAAGEDDIGINLLILPEFFETAIGMLDKNTFLATFIIDLMRQKSRESQYLHFKLGENLQTNNLMENLIFSLIYRQSNAARINQTVMGLLFLYLLENADCLRKDAPNNYEDVLIRSVLLYVEQRYKTAALSELAADMNFPVPHLSRFIKKKTGRTFKELLQQRRVEAAQTLLCDTTLAINDVVAAVGYENNSYFFRRFREIHGISPKEYRMRAACRVDGKNANKDTVSRNRRP